MPKQKDTIFCGKVWRQNATVIQLWSHFLANRAINGVTVTDSQ